MENLNASSFEPLSYQATIFTQCDELVVSRILSAFYPKIASQFDADPTVLPPLPAGVPKDVPRILLSGKTGEWRLEIGTARINVHWSRQVDTSIVAGSFFEMVADLFAMYQELIECPVHRLAGLVNRFAKKDQPGLYLAQHFCKAEWLQQPLNRPESFEIHAHKRFKLGKEFDVNSWARSKTGFVQPGKVAVVLFEQDINTVVCDETPEVYDVTRMKRFFAAASSEVDSILEHYFPNAK